MVRFSSDDDVRKLGEALAALRRDMGLSQAEAGARVGMTSQGWGLYESGRRSGLFRPDVQRRLTGALETTPEALMLRLRPDAAPAASPVQGVEAGTRAFRPAPASGEVRMMQLTSDDMAPWAGAGVTVAYRPGQTPRPGQGCVLRLTDGRLMVRLFETEDADGLHVRMANGGKHSVARTDLIEISAVVGRLEDQ
ncbi:helix-turn-helix domain-containing protein [Brevundimonas sp.]|uniref:helix-turn-helix domain-containing protein n=1 Tax=Brevundimonas sp. TaxID=1871086 RepID=UPI002FDA5F43